jgi:hypothetical protein
MKNKKELSINYNYLRNIIQNMIIYLKKLKLMHINNENEVNKCIEKIQEISNVLHLNNLEKHMKVENKIMENKNEIPKNIYFELNQIIKAYGIRSLVDLFKIYYNGEIGYHSSCFINSEEDIYVFEILENYFHPLNYDSIPSKKTFEQKHIQCMEISLKEKTDMFYLKTHGIQIQLFCKKTKNVLIMNGTMDDLVVEFLDNSYLKQKIQQVKDKVIKYNSFFNVDIFTNYILSLNIKDLLIQNSEKIFLNYKMLLDDVIVIKQKNIPENINDFLSGTMYEKRNYIIKLLVFDLDIENQYLAYLLYDLLSNEKNDFLDTHEQIIIFDSLTWPIKKKFKDAIKNTFIYANTLNRFDMNKVPLEQQICLMKAPDYVKEKAMIKLKEIKSKGDDSVTKAKQYLDGLLKIPFGIYKKEKILFVMEQIKNNFQFIVNLNTHFVPVKNNYSNLEIINYVKMIKNNVDINLHFENIKTELNLYDKDILLEKIKLINNFIDLNNIKYKKNKKVNNKTFIIENIIGFIHYCCIHNIEFDYTQIYNKHNKNDTFEKIQEIESDVKMIHNYMVFVRKTLDDSVYGHDKAKNHLERIIANWINGKSCGHCFGFEGPPGVGKTSLAKKGLSKCLKDDYGNSRPFSMIQIGGDSNGSSLHGHNYTYVGSSWGSILQILMDKKIMNPIILIDEVDKISKTENGKELIGILTHMLDNTQNECFQDKYFNGIDIDLSKVLFILSYNEPELIDKILLDRVHRIKFETLSLNEKLIIANKFLLPEIYENIGLQDTIFISDCVIKYIIEEYTSESGVRKLKEILFEIVGEINLRILKSETFNKIPIEVSIDDLKNTYLKDHYQVKYKKIHETKMTGIINGLWASNYNKGGIISIQVYYFPCNNFLELKLSGSLGDVMKESVNVAFTLAWNLTSHEKKEEIKQKYKIETTMGLHLHCPEGSVNKEGPSAGTAITLAFYSLLNNKEISNLIAITGEISLDGSINEIGGLNLKIMGAIKAGVKTILFPKENEKDYEKFILNHNNKELLKDITFYPVSNIKEVLDIVFI